MNKGLLTPCREPMTNQSMDIIKVPLGELGYWGYLQEYRREATYRSRNDTKVVESPKVHPSMGDSS